jgi:hypothetical protein
LLRLAWTGQLSTGIKRRIGNSIQGVLGLYAAQGRRIRAVDKKNSLSMLLGNKMMVLSLPSSNSLASTICLSAVSRHRALVRIFSPRPLSQTRDYLTCHLIHPSPRRRPNHHPPPSLSQPLSFPFHLSTSPTKSPALFQSPLAHNLHPIFPTEPASQPASQLARSPSFQPASPVIGRLPLHAVYRVPRYRLAGGGGCGGRGLEA